MELRPYQQKMLERLRFSMRAHDKVLAVLPTGGGKTIIFSEIARRAAASGKKVQVLVHRRELLAQAVGKLGDCCEVNTIQGWTPAPCDLVIVDEAHHATARSWREKIDAAGGKLLGFTATPQRLDGSGLSTVFDTMVQGPTVRQLILGGFLSSYRLYAPPGRPDLTGIRRVRGDYSRKALGEAVGTRGVVAAALKNWKMYGIGRQTIGFCVSVAHMEQVAATFREAGVRVGTIDGKQTPGARADAVRDFKAGRIQVLLSVELISEGFDCPDADCILMLRPTASLAMYLQQVGRGLRPSSQECLILDCAGNSVKHGMPCADREWSLASERVTRDGVANVAVRVCSRCFSCHRPGVRVCPFCGFQHPLDSRIPEEREILLQEKKKEAREMRRDVGRARSAEELMELAKRRGYSPKWVDHVLRSRGISRY